MLGERGHLHQRKDTVLSSDWNLLHFLSSLWSSISKSFVNVWELSLLIEIN